MYTLKFHLEFLTSPGFIWRKYLLPFLCRKKKETQSTLKTLLESSLTSIPTQFSSTVTCPRDLADRVIVVTLDMSVILGNPSIDILPPNASTVLI